MLVLSRKKNECLILTTPDGERIKVSVLRIAGGRARLGIDADRSIEICRGELEPKKAA